MQSAAQQLPFPTSPEVGMILAEIRALREQLESPRKPAAPGLMWVAERELPDYIPYSIKEIRAMRQKGTIKGYPDLRGGKRYLYNLHEINRTHGCPVKG